MVRQSSRLSAKGKRGRLPYPTRVIASPPDEGRGNLWEENPHATLRLLRYSRNDDGNRIHRQDSS
ncbi:MAG: hypothetical protein PHY28_02565 [Dehalococcoidales bacterium]|nr:hypothetical protein [Dehalococcoidales bacterium]